MRDGQLERAATMTLARAENAKVGIAQGAQGPKVDLSNVRVAEAALTERERQVLQLEPGETPEAPQLPDGLWPVVETRNGRRMLCAPLDFAVQNAEGRDEATRRQVPLILAWA